MDPRQTARELLEFAGLDYRRGRPCTDPVYKAITESRQDRALRANQFYSSCGDLAHWLLYRMGVRAKWVNRDEHKGWIVEKNINLLGCRQIHGSNPVAKPAKFGDVYEAGDIIIVSKNGLREHAICVIDHIPDIGLLTTCEYGQPHGVLRKRQLLPRKEGGIMRNYIVDREVVSVLRLYDALNADADADRCVEPEPLATYQLRFSSERLV